jgi:hypothetical protein
MSDNQEYDEQTEDQQNGNGENQDEQNYDDDVSQWTGAVIIELVGTLRAPKLLQIESEKIVFDVLVWIAMLDDKTSAEERESMTRSFRFEPSTVKHMESASHGISSPSRTRFASQNARESCLSAVSITGRTTKRWRPTSRSGARSWTSWWWRIQRQSDLVASDSSRTRVRAWLMMHKPIGRMWLMAG